MCQNFLKVHWLNIAFFTCLVFLNSRWFLLKLSKYFGLISPQFKLICKSELGQLAASVTTFLSNLWSSTRLTEVRKTHDAPLVFGRLLGFLPNQIDLML